MFYPFNVFVLWNLPVLPIGIVRPNGREDQFILQGCTPLVEVEDGDLMCIISLDIVGYGACVA